ncbi:hypothetical protein [Pseudosulfitobacter pseudonitzschiae]|uniref:hypothetical protein n=1 Tax=Pseudosulfitobacter pseudonitzschiae TaxID=1402135 RepID=UPI003B805661
MTRTREENARHEMNASAQRASVVSALVEAGVLSGMVLNRFIASNMDAETFQANLKKDPLPDTSVDAEGGFITFDGTVFDAEIFCSGVEDRFNQICNERNRVIFDAFGEPDVITGAGNRWYVIRDLEGAKVASGYGETGLAHFWDRLEKDGDNEGHTWAVMFDDTTRARISLAALSKDVVPQLEAKIADCHVTGYMNKDSFEDYKADIMDFCAAMNLVVYPNHMGRKIEPVSDEPGF